MTTSEPIRFDGRIDAFLTHSATALRGLPEFRDLYIWVLNAQVDREKDRKKYKRPRAPIAWNQTMQEIAKITGWE